jgi:hypothetical protein
MVRTQISLDKKDYLLAKKTAKAQGISVAELFRRALRQSLPDTGKAPRDAPWLRFLGMVDSGDPHASQTIDEVLYGIKR